MDYNLNLIFVGHGTFFPAMMASMPDYHQDSIRKLPSAIR